MNIELFLNIIAWLGVILSGSRIVFMHIELRDPETARLVDLADKMGADLVGSRLRKNGLIIIVCFAWIISGLVVE